MAKQSAKSKGYRKTIKKKPFLTKKEIIELVVIVAVIVLGILLFNLFYDDGLISAGQVQPNDVVSFANQQAKGRYAKVAEIGELEGFTLSESEDSDMPSISRNFFPDEETDHIFYISLAGSYLSLDELSQRNMSSPMPGISYEYTDVQNAQVQGHEARISSYTYDYYAAPEEAAEGDEAPADDAETPADGEAPAEDAEALADDEAPADDAETPADDAEASAEGDADAQPESNCFCQTLNCYVEVGDFSLCLHIYRTGDDSSIYLPEDEIVDYVLGYTDFFTICERDD